MNQPTPIIVKDGMGREDFIRPTPPVNCGNSMVDEINEESYAENIIEYNRLVNEATWYPCPAIANTEPGKTILAEIVWQSYDNDYKRWEDYKPSETDTWKKFQSFFHTTRQIWVPIVEQKEGEGKPNAFISMFLQDNQFKLVEGNNHYANDYCGVVINEKNIEVANNNGDVLYSHDLNIYWLVGVLTWYGYLPRNYNKL